MKVVGIVLLIIAALGVFAGVMLLLMLPDSAYEGPSGFDDWMTNSDPGSQKTYKGTLADETYQNLSGTPTKAYRFKGCTYGFLSGSDIGNIGDEVIAKLEVREAGGMHYAYFLKTESGELYYLPGILVLVFGVLFGFVGIIVLIIGAVRKGRKKAPVPVPKKQGAAPTPEKSEKRAFAPPPPPPD